MKSEKKKKKQVGEVDLTKNAVLVLNAAARLRSRRAFRGRRRGSPGVAAGRREMRRHHPIRSFLFLFFFELHPFFSWITATRVRHRQWVPLMAWGRTYDRSPFRPKQYGPHDTPTGHPLSDTGFDFAKHPATNFFPGNHSDLLLLD